MFCFVCFFFYLNGEGIFSKITKDAKEEINKKYNLEKNGGKELLSKIILEDNFGFEGINFQLLTISVRLYILAYLHGTREETYRATIERH